MARKQWDCVVAPSDTASCQLLRGERGAGLKVLGCLLGRAAIIGTGIALFSDTRGKELLKASLGSAAVVTGFNIGWAQYMRRCRR